MADFVNKNHKLILLLLIGIGAGIRLYKLNWGAPFYFHPDERNIASAISQLRFPDQLNPHFFAYGGLPIYISFTIGIIQNWVTSILGGGFDARVGFEQAILILRFLSATCSTLLIPLIYFLGKQIENREVGLIAAVLTTVGPGLIQFAHFGTFEMWLTLFSLMLFYAVLNAWKRLTTKTILLLAGTIGSLIAIKVSSLALFPLSLVPFAKHNAKALPHRLARVLLFVTIIFSIWIITNPFSLLDFQSFWGSMRYESQVALGELKVFYTGEFLNIVRGIFPFLHIYPFLLNPLLTFLSIPAFLVVAFTAWKEKNRSYTLLLLFTSILLLSQLVLFVQWTRYFVPTIPFFFLLISIFLEKSITNLSQRMRSGRILKLVLLFSIMLLSALYTFAFLKTVYLSSDTRVAASDYARTTFPSSTKILSEAYDLGIVPFNSVFPSITLFNFYDLDNDSSVSNTKALKVALENSDIIILPSQRILKTRLQNSEAFPIGHAFYSTLSQGTPEFTKVYETPCDIFCNIVYLGNPVFSLEQTVNIFDRPTVFIYRINHEK